MKYEHDALDELVYTGRLSVDSVLAPRFRPFWILLFEKYKGGALWFWPKNKDFIYDLVKKSMFLHFSTMYGLLVYTGFLPGLSCVDFPVGSRCFSSKKW